MEVELGWGVHDLGTYDHLSPDARVERAYLRRLLARCEETNIPILFNVVGHLLLDGCDGNHAGPYPSNWFDADPGTNLETDGLFYAPDIVDQIAASPVAHELCSLIGFPNSETRPPWSSSSPSGTFRWLVEWAGRVEKIPRLLPSSRSP